MTPLIAAPLLLGACGDDNETSTTTTGGAVGGAETVEVTADDYRFEGIPETVEAGTKFTLTNVSDVELHEFVAVLLPDDEDRSVEELVALPEEELGALFGSAEPATVLFAPPGGDMIPAVGDGTLADAGRYIVICAIPTGADPQEYMEAAAAAAGGPPEVDGGPPHFTAGMYAEVTVE